MPKIKKEKFKNICFSAPKQVSNMITEISNKRGVSLSESIRYIIERFYRTEWLKENKGYGGALEETKSIKEKEKEKQAELSNMSDEELTDFLIDCGYLTTERPVTDGEGERNFFRKFITTKADGKRVLFIEYYNKDTGQVYSYGDMMSLEDTLKEAKRKGFI